MNIIQAREAAMAGKTVTCPSGFNYSKASFSNVEEWDKASIFGEWEIKQEPVVFEATVHISDQQDILPAKRWRVRSEKENAV